MSDPLTRRLQQMTKDAANAISSTLILFTGIREMKRPRALLQSEIKALQEQTNRVLMAFNELDVFLDILSGKASEISEAELVTIVERLSDSVMLSQQMATIENLDYITCAMKMRHLEPEKMALSIREIASHPGGKGQLELWRDAIEEALR